MNASSLRVRRGLSAVAASLLFRFSAGRLPREGQAAAGKTARWRDQGASWISGRLVRHSYNYAGQPILKAAKAASASLCKPSRLQKLLRSEEHTSELQSLRHLVCR